MKIKNSGKQIYQEKCVAKSSKTKNKNMPPFNMDVVTTIRIVYSWFLQRTAEQATLFRALSKTHVLVKVVKSFTQLSFIFPSSKDVHEISSNQHHRLCWGKNRLNKGYRYQQVDPSKKIAISLSEKAKREVKKGRKMFFKIMLSRHERRNSFLRLYAFLGK